MWIVKKNICYYCCREFHYIANGSGDWEMTERGEQELCYLRRLVINKKNIKRIFNVILFRLSGSEIELAWLIFAQIIRIASTGNQGLKKVNA